MPILKTEILGSEIEISYEKNEYKKLIKLIENFKKRLDEFPVNRKVNTNAIIFLAALKAEDKSDELNEIIKNIEKNIEVDQLIVKQLNIKNEELENEIILLKNKIEKINTENLSQSNIISDSLNLINKMQNKINLISNKIKISFNND